MEAVATQVHLTKYFPVSPQAVYEAWTTESVLKAWFAPNPEYYAHVDVLDVRVGGKYRIEMRHQGGNTHTIVGQYKQLEPPHLLSFTWNWEGADPSTESVVTVILEEGPDGGTRLTLNHTGLGEEAAREHTSGWNGCLKQLENVFHITPSRHASALLGLQRRLFLNALDGLTAQHLTTRLNDRINHPLWVAGHIAHTRWKIARLLGDDTESPLAIFDEAISDTAAYPDIEAVGSYMDTISGVVQRLLYTTDSDFLSAPSPYPYELPINDQTVGGVLNFFIHHEAYHIGQLGILRKALGYSAMSYDTAIDDTPHHGRFTWYDNVTTDPDKAIDFYVAVAGWSTEVWNGGGSASSPYTMFTNQDASLGGVVALPEDASGTPPHWLAYIGTRDVKETFEQALTLGAQVLKEPFEVQGVGQISILQDPQGAVFGLYQPERAGGGHSANPIAGEISWHELMAPSADEALRFYQDLFGWQKTGEHDMGEDRGVYRMFGRTDQSMGGVFNKPPSMPGPAVWLFYIGVDDIDDAVERVRENGGSVTQGPTEIPGGGWIAHCVDPLGAVFALHMDNTTV